jgi:inorganic phosphate transporter, PiT family
MLTILLILATLGVAYANGANDNFKGVATLYGSGAANYRTALALTTVATACGGLISVVFAAGLIKTFSGAGVVPADIAASPAFLTAIACGAAGTVFLATLVGLPISTTHALTGAIVGAGLVMVGTGLNFSVLGKSFILPLLLGPFISIGLTSLVYFAATRISRRLGKTGDPCLCLEEAPVLASTGTMAFAAGSQLTLTARASANDCADVQGLRLTGSGMANAVHFVSAGMLCLARGMNDAPKIVALLLAANALGVRNGLLAIVFAMALGGVINARKVARTMSHRITHMSDGQALSANIVSAALVIAASRFGLPVSTTHVTVGAITGTGLINRTANLRVLGGIAASWIGTLPLAALLAALAALLLKFTAS